ncbi:MAG: glycerol-3-phosphate 1-O-acyltransferase PlsY [Acidisphaera sp.]|nr:glycerol-3-phosphate 1-O-acyltransferase PlsY [Acidisphaera sp.]
MLIVGAIACFIGYALGSVPFGLLLTRAAGLGDIRRVGSGNIGATNVLRTGRGGLAAATLLLDAAKGIAAVLLLRPVLGPDWAALAGLAAVLGHCFPIWLKGRGGKGVATGLGVILAMDWRIGLAALAVWLVVAKIARISSLAALSALLAATVLGPLLRPGWIEAVLVAIALLVFVRHAGNIGRLLAGTEPRIGAGG